MALSIRQDDAATDRSEPYYWQWRVWIEGDDRELDEIDSVRYQLHRTFREPTRVVTDRSSKFALSSMGWGEFTIYAAVQFKDPAREEQPLVHWLRLGGTPKDSPTTTTLAGATPGVFLSSSFADTHLAKQIADALRTRQVRVIDPNEPKPPGISFAGSVASKLDEADIAVVIVGERTSEWSKWETEKLIAEDKGIIPVVFAENVPDPLAKFDAIRIKPGESAGAIADRIVGLMPGLKDRWSVG